MSRPGAMAGRAALVTGAAGTLGAAIVDRFQTEEVRAVVLVDHDRDALEERASALDGMQVLAVNLDVTDHDAVLAAVARADVEVGGLDVVVNNAGVNASSARIHHVQPDDLQHVLDVNLAGVFHVLKAAVQVMRPRGDGTIVNTASVAGQTAWTHASPYGASKAAVIHLTRIAAVEYAADGIRVNCVCPGTFLTSFHENTPPEVLDGIRARHPLGRFGTAEEIAGAYAYLAGNDARWITGTSLTIDGGLSAAG